MSTQHTPQNKTDFIETLLFDDYPINDIPAADQNAKKIAINMALSEFKRVQQKRTKSHSSDRPSFLMSLVTWARNLNNHRGVTTACLLVVCLGIFSIMPSRYDKQTIQQEVVGNTFDSSLTTQTSDVEFEAIQTSPSAEPSAQLNSLEEVVVSSHKKQKTVLAEKPLSRSIPTKTNQPDLFHNQADVGKAPSSKKFKESESLSFNKGSKALKQKTTRTKEPKFLEAPSLESPSSLSQPHSDNVIRYELELGKWPLAEQVNSQAILKALKFIEPSNSAPQNLNEVSASENLVQAVDAFSEYLKHQTKPNQYPLTMSLEEIIHLSNSIDNNTLGKQKTELLYLLTLAQNLSRDS